VIELNTARTLLELDFDNNRVEIPVVLGDASLATPTEPCPAGLDPHSSDGPHRECGWTLAGVYDCEPGDVRVGCNDRCSNSVGSCTGDPMLRVCDAESPSGNCTYFSKLADSND